MNNQSSTNNSNYKHGHTGSRKGNPSPTYKSWQGLKERCNNPHNKRYDRYGERGISYCPEWETFAGFLADMKECPYGLSIDRIDNDKGYSPDNCRWATAAEQASNRSDNVRYTFQGKTQTQAQWARELGLGEKLLNNRINRDGWSVEKALSTPIRVQGAARQSHFTGVNWYKTGSKWHATARVNGKRKHLGYFQYEFDAFLAIHEFKQSNPL